MILIKSRQTRKVAQRARGSKKTGDTRGASQE